MNISYKREFIFGMVSIFIVIILIIITTIRYEQRISQLPNTAIFSKNNVNVILTQEEIAKHSLSTDCWIIIENKVYSATDYLIHHPGGADQIIPYCGKDATQAFLTKGGRGTHSAEAFRQLGILYIGDINGKLMQQPDKNTINSLPVGKSGDND